MRRGIVGMARDLNGPFLWLGLGVGISYWFLDAVFMSFGLGIGSLGEMIFDPGPDDISMRTGSAIISTVFGGFAQWKMNKERWAREALGHSESRYAAVAQSTIDAIVAIDGKGTVVSWNRAAEHIFGHEADEMLGRPLDDVIPERFRHAHGAGIERLLRGEKSRIMGKSVELQGLRKNGEEFPIELSLGRWKTGEGDFFSGIIRDISERKESLDELRRAKETAESADQAKTRFLANASHELRTPLNSIIGFSDILTSDLLGSMGNPEHREYVVNINRAGHQLLSAINNILDISKMETGTLSLDEKCVSVQQVVNNCCGQVVEKVEKAGLTLETRLKEPACYLFVDESRFKQIILNLLSNAFKFSLPGGTIVIETGLADSKAFVIAVSDTGIGMKPGDIERALSAFDFVGDPMINEDQGLGLGLPICRNLAELHGGHLELESKLSKGTTVKVTFPKERVIFV